MCLHAHGDVDVAGRAAERARVTVAADADPLTVVDPRRDLEIERDVLEDPAVSLASWARRLDDPAGAVAARAGPGTDHLSENRPRHLLDATRAGARRAGDRRRARRCPGPAARLARASCPDVDVQGGAGRRGSEIDLDVRSHIGAAGRSRAGAGPAAEQRLAEERGEDVREAPEVGVRWSESAAPKARVAEAVVRPPPLGIGQHLVGLRDHAETLPRRPAPR